MFDLIGNQEVPKIREFRVLTPGTGQVPSGGKIYVENAIYCFQSKKEMFKNWIFIRQSANDMLLILAENQKNQSRKYNV